MIEVTPWDILTSSEKYPEREKSEECTSRVRIYAADLAERVSRLLNHLNISAKVSSGFRTSAVNASIPNSAKRSAHMLGCAVDLEDHANALDDAIMKDPGVLTQFDLYLESPHHTPGWCHIQTVRPPSGNRIFLP
jgi:hypothetical protein